MGMNSVVIPDIVAAADIVENADTVIILAGAGLSAELGVLTYWSSADSAYGGGKTAHGYTPLEHADAGLWMQDTGAQIAYFAEKREHFASINFFSSHYRSLLESLQGKNYFCVTSNVDSGFLRAGFDGERLFEVHGSYGMVQCVIDATHGLFRAVEDGTRTCDVCGMPTRPNALFFNDRDFNPQIMYAQQDRFNRFVDELEENKSRVVLVEIGVGVTVPRVRQIGNRLYRDLGGPDYLHVNTEPRPEFLFGEACSFENREQWLQMPATVFIDALK